MRNGSGSKRLELSGALEFHGWDIYMRLSSLSVLETNV